MGWAYWGSSRAGGDFGHFLEGSGDFVVGICWYLFDFVFDGRSTLAKMFWLDIEMVWAVM